MYTQIYARSAGKQQMVGGWEQSNDKKRGRGESVTVEKREIQRGK